MRQPDVQYLASGEVLQLTPFKEGHSIKLGSLEEPEQIITIAVAIDALPEDLLGRVVDVRRVYDKARRIGRTIQDEVLTAEGAYTGVPLTGAAWNRIMSRRANEIRYQ